jgi:chromosome partitioning protein
MLDIYILYVRIPTVIYLSHINTYHKDSMRSIAFINQKGGVGKTTSTANVGACLATLGKKVLMIDLDPQGNMSMHLGVNVHGKDLSIYQLICGKRKVTEILAKTEISGLDIIPSDIDLASAEIELVNTGRT